MIQYTDKELLDIARKNSENAYSPYSGIKVGAVIETEDGELFSGVNVENASYGGTICAERTAAVKAVSEGSKVFKRIAVAGSIKNLVPCGLCRQFLWEFGKNMKVIYEDEEGNMVIKTLRELFPCGFEI